MDSYYGNAARNSGEGGQQTPAQMPELGRIKAATERVARAATRTENFIERFNGPTPTGGGDTAEKQMDTYRNDLSSLFAQIERLECVVSALDSIG